MSSSLPRRLFRSIAVIHANVKSTHRGIFLQYLGANLVQQFVNRAAFRLEKICAAYVIEEGTLKVKTPGGEKGARFGGSNPDELAERLLRELAAHYFLRCGG